MYLTQWNPVKRRHFLHTGGSYKWVAIHYFITKVLGNHKCIFTYLPMLWNKWLSIVYIAEPRWYVYKEKRERETYSLRERMIRRSKTKKKQSRNRHEHLMAFFTCACLSTSAGACCGNLRARAPFPNTALCSIFSVHNWARSKREIAWNEKVSTESYCISRVQCSKYPHSAKLNKMSLWPGQAK